MKGGTQAALAIGVGYILGRRRKMRLATLLAAGAATGGLASLSGVALKRGAKMLGNTEMLNKVSPQLGEIADAVRGDLLDAGKAAAIAAVNTRIESLTDNLHERAESIRDPAAAAAGAGEAVTGRVRGRRASDNGDAEETEDYDEQDLPEDADESGEAEELEDDEMETAPPRRRSARRSSPVTRARR